MAGCRWAKQHQAPARAGTHDHSKREGRERGRRSQEEGGAKSAGGSRTRGRGRDVRAHVDLGEVLPGRATGRAASESHHSESGRPGCGCGGKAGGRRGGDCESAAGDGTPPAPPRPPPLPAPRPSPPHQLTRHRTHLLALFRTAPFLHTPPLPPRPRPSLGARACTAHSPHAPTQLPVDPAVRP